MIFSIIMPAYNCEKYIKNSINSVLKQECTEWELIIVNDGSTDNTNDICTEFVKNNKKIKLINTENQGPASARNIGIKNAKGDYVLFLDADDILETNALEEIKKRIDKVKPDLIIFNYYNDIWESENVENHYVRKLTNQTILNNMQFNKVYQELDDNFMTYPVWNKAYNRQFILNIQAMFPQRINVAEDFVFNMSIYKNVEKIDIMDMPLYHYIFHAGESLSQKFDANKFDYITNVYKMTKEFYKQWKPEMINKAHNMYIYDISVFINNMFNKNSEISYKEKKKYIDKILKNNEVCDCLNKIECTSRRNKIVVALLKHKYKKMLLMVGKVSRIGK